MKPFGSFNAAVDYVKAHCCGPVSVMVIDHQNRAMTCYLMEAFRTTNRDRFVRAKALWCPLVRLLKENP